MMRDRILAVLVSLVLLLAFALYLGVIVYLLVTGRHGFAVPMLLMPVVVIGLMAVWFDDGRR